MAKHLPYAAWVRHKLDRIPEEQRQDRRKDFYSPGGRIAMWDTYKAECKAAGQTYDGPPDGYWESKELWWHKPAGYLMGITGLFIWLLVIVIGGSTGMSKGK